MTRSDASRPTSARSGTQSHDVAPGLGARARRLFTFRRCALTLLAAYCAVFFVYPIGRAFVGALQHWNPATGEAYWIGLANFRRIFADSLFWSSCGRTLVYALGATGLRLIIGLALALLLSSKLIHGRNALRSLFFLPSLTPIVAVALMWGWMFDPGLGLVDRLFGLTTGWLHDPVLAGPTFIGLTVWKDFGYAMLLYLAALLNVPRDLVDAAHVDGAGALQTFRYVTLPAIRPMTWYLAVVSLIGYLQMYVPIIVLTSGGPGDATTTVGYLIYRQAYKLFDFGTASAMGVVMLAVCAAIAAVLLCLTKRGEGERR